MHSRRQFLAVTLGGTAVFVTSAAVPGAQGEPSTPVQATAITQVFGEGQKLIAVALDFGQEIDPESLNAGDFAVEGRTVTRVYTSDVAEPSAGGRPGHFVIVELSLDDDLAATFAQKGRETIRREAVARVTRLGQIAAGTGEALGAGIAPLVTNGVRNLVVDDFETREYHDAATGITLKYNIFVPPGYTPGTALPLVLFMHDAGTTSDDPTTTLVQGLGAISFASPGDQARRPAFVLAPQYEVQVVNDSSEATGHLDATVNLIGRLVEEYGLDTARLYATGQSGGCMMSIAMNIKYPDLFAASFLVAGQWDPVLVAPLAKDRLFIMVSEGDLKAYPGQNAITGALEAEGARVARAVWDGTWTSEAFRAACDAIVHEGASINYVALRRGTVVPEGQEDSGGANHVNTWRIAYAIEPIREWLFEQRR